MNLWYRLLHPRESFYRYLSTLSEGHTSEKKKGFIIIQIDGLSYFALRRALKLRFMPFVSSLLRSQTHKIARFDCGLPATTPAFMAGLMYGKNDNIPGFRWYDKKRREFFIMKSLRDAERLEKGLSSNEGILKGGSSYCTIFTGGAKESVFTVSKLYVLNRYIKVGLIPAILLILFNLTVILRIFISLFLELFIELKEYIMQVIVKDVRRSEPPFIPIRLITNVLLREISTLLAEVDIYRNVDSIYIDYIGYDELAHHRGPFSISSLLTLFSIDRDIKRLFKAVRKSGNYYDIYILSDHGQVATLPFNKVRGESFDDYLIKQMLETKIIQTKGYIELLRNQRLLSFVNYLQSIRQTLPAGFGFVADQLIKRISKRIKEDNPEIEVGDVNQIFLLPTSDLLHLYFNRFTHRLMDDEIDRYYPKIKKLILQEGNIAAILYMSKDGVVIETTEGKSIINNGKLHNIRGSVSNFFSMLYSNMERDIERLVRMENAGDIVIFSGRYRGRVLNFQDELGGHGGPYPEEQSSFIIFPKTSNFNFYLVRNSTELYKYLKGRYF